jgi:hypothetical protein
MLVSSPDTGQILWEISWIIIHDLRQIRICHTIDYTEAGKKFIRENERGIEETLRKYMDFLKKLPINLHMYTYQIPNVFSWRSFISRRVGTTFVICSIRRS